MISNACDTLRNGDARETFARRKCRNFNACDALRNGNVGKVFTQTKCINSNASDGIVKKCAVEENPKSEIDRYQAAW